MRSYADTVGIVGTTAPSSSSSVATLRLYVWLEFPGFAAVVSNLGGGEGAGEVRRAARADLLPAYGV